MKTSKEGDIIVKSHPMPIEAKNYDRSYMIRNEKWQRRNEMRLQHDYYVVKNWELELIKTEYDSEWTENWPFNSLLLSDA